MFSFSERRTLVLCCISIFLVLEVVYITKSDFFDLKNHVAKYQFERVNAWFNDDPSKEETVSSGSKNAEGGSRKQRNDTIFKHRSNFALLEVNIEETSLKFVLKNKKGKGILYFVVLSRWIFFKTTTVVQY